MPPKASVAQVRPELATPDSVLLANRTRSSNKRARASSSTADGDGTGNDDTLDTDDRSDTSRADGDGNGNPSIAQSVDRSVGVQTGASEHDGNAPVVDVARLALTVNTQSKLILDLQARLEKAETKADRTQQIRDFEERGTSKFHFDRALLESAAADFIVPHINDPILLDSIASINWAHAPRDEISRVFSLLTKLPKSERNAIFARNLRDSDCSTMPRELSANEAAFYSKEQKEKDKKLVEQHTNFAPVLQVLYHLLVNLVQVDADFDGTVDAQDYHAAWVETSATACDLASLLLEYFGKFVAQPRRDLFESATGLTSGTPSGFLTQKEASSAMEQALQSDLILSHAAAFQARQSTGRGSGKSRGGRNNRSRGKGGRGRGGSFNTALSRSAAASAAAASTSSAPAALPPSTPAAGSAPAASTSTPRNQGSKGPKGRGRGKS